MASPQQSGSRWSKRPALSRWQWNRRWKRLSWPTAASGPADDVTWATADTLRAEIEALGWVVQDTAEGPRVSQRMVNGERLTVDG